MINKEQMAKWEIDFIKYKSIGMLDRYIINFYDYKNPFIKEALNHLDFSKKYDLKSFYNIPESYPLTIDTLEYAREYRNCKTQKDYEAYFVKYNGEKNNPFIDSAKEHIIVRNEIGMLQRILVMLLCFGVAAVMLYLASLGEGSSNSYAALLCIVSGLAGIAAAIIGIVFLFNPRSCINLIRQVA